MSANFLNQILEYKRKVVEQRRHLYDRLQKQLSTESYPRYKIFKSMISKAGRMNLIAEIKKASPSKGMIRENFDLLSIAEQYTLNGASAISVLTEDKYFLGRPEYIKKVSENVNVPVLTKDFIIDEGQIFEARFNGASAVLLIAAVLSDKDLERLQKVAHSLDLDCLVEVHNLEELKRVIDLGSEIIGINNRNLHTFEVDLQTTLKLLPQVPDDRIIVTESGYHTSAQIKEAHQQGAHAVLIGEYFMKHADIVKAMKELSFTKGDG